MIKKEPQYNFLWYDYFKVKYQKNIMIHVNYATKREKDKHLTCIEIRKNKRERNDYPIEVQFIENKSNKKFNI